MKQSDPQAVLVTGGAGYIGSHVTRQLTEAGYRVVVLDNLSTGSREALLYGETLVVGDAGDQKLVEQLLGETDCNAVLHFAASIVAPESVIHPLDYYANNTATTIALLRACVKVGVTRFIFSSTAAVYGEPAGGLAAEDAPTSPVNPYGTSKLMSEWILRDTAYAHGLHCVALRYFNVAGADPQCRMGQRTPRATHLIKVCCEAALGMREQVAVFGTDYPTPDGTGVRDYIHVEDLAAAHLSALRYLDRLSEPKVLNVGYGRGYSVRQVIDAVKRVSGVDFAVTAAPRRPGDPSMLVARAERIRELLGWTPRYADLDTIVDHALAWERRRSAGG